MKAYTFTNEDLTAQTNRAIDVYLADLLAEEVITLEQFNQMSSYRIVVREKGLFGSFIDKMLHTDKDSSFITTVKVINKALNDE